MTVTLNDICNLMEEIAPAVLAADWDNVGLMLGRRGKEVRSIMLALDMTEQTVQQVIASGADLLITHHPAVFNPLHSVTDADWQQELLLCLAEHGVAVYSAHTNLDCVRDGVNDALAKRLRLKGAESLDPESGLGRIGFVEACELNSFAAFVKKQLRADYIVIGDAGRSVAKVAVCGGAGADLISLAVARGADTLVTGDVKYHSAQEAVFKGLNIIDAGHQPTELPVLEQLASKLSKSFAEKEWSITVSVAQEKLLLTVV